MFADKFNANNYTYPSRERRPRRSVGFVAFSRTATRAVPTIILLNFQFLTDDAHIVPKSYMSLFACGESVRRGRRTLRIFATLTDFNYKETGTAKAVPEN